VTTPDKSETGGKLAAGLYLVAVPIGHAQDITLRALDLLRNADVLAAEDTRAMRRLMDLHGIALGGRPLVAYHDHNGARARPRLLEAIAQGQSVAYASEAGTPMVSDPGFDLARAVRSDGGMVTAAPGASAVVQALVLSGLPTDRFFFAGFLPSAASARRKALSDLAPIPGTLALYESPRRLVACLHDAADRLGDRQAAVCRELTKTFEEVRQGSLSELADHYTNAPPKGEIVLVIDKGDSSSVREVDIEQEVNKALETMSVRDAADYVSARFGVKRRAVYQMAMRLTQTEGDT